MKVSGLTNGERAEVNSKEAITFFNYIESARQIFRSREEGNRFEPLLRLCNRIEKEQSHFLDKSDGDAISSNDWYSICGEPTEFDFKHFVFHVSNDEGFQVLLQIHADVNEQLERTVPGITISWTQFAIILLYGALRTDLHREKCKISGRVEVCNCMVCCDDDNDIDDKGNTKESEVRYSIPKIDKRVTDMEKALKSQQEIIDELTSNTQIINQMVFSLATFFQKYASQINKLYEKDAAKILLENNEFLKILQKAVNDGFCEKAGWQYKWKVKVEAAYFAYEASHKFELSNRKDHSGDLAVAWKPFEALFGEENLRSAYNDYKQARTAIKQRLEIQSYFK